MATETRRVRKAPGVPVTEHVVFVHGLFGANLVLRADPSQQCWSDNPLHFLRTVLRQRDLLTNLTDPRPLIPKDLTHNYALFVERLNFLGFHNVEQPKLSLYIYDWRLGIAEASAGLDTLLDSVPAKTSIVAHSLGGLVVLYAIASGSISKANLDKLSRVVLIATPYLGSTFALLGLAKSGDFLRRAGEFLPGLLKTLFGILRFAPDVLTDVLAPTFGSFQSLYDMIPHDVDQESLRILKLPQFQEPVTTQRWPFWTATPDAGRMRGEALRVQRIIRNHEWPMEVVSIFSEADDTPHWCMVSSAPPWKITQPADGGHTKGDAIVAACCTFPSSDAASRKLIWADRPDGPTSHSRLLQHPKTHAFLRELLT